MEKSDWIFVEVIRVMQTSMLADKNSSLQHSIQVL